MAKEVKWVKIICLVDSPISEALLAAETASGNQKLSKTATLNAAQIKKVARSILDNPAVPVDLAEKLAKQYFSRYKGRRGSMVVDVVASAWRNYDRVEKQIVPAFEKSVRTPSLKALAQTTPNIPGLRNGEAAAMQAAAAGLLRFAAEKRSGAVGDDEKIVKAWAKYAEPFRFETKIEPYVGSVKRVGPALFAYLRMRAGADAIKADVWVARVLQQHGAKFKKVTDVIEVTRVAEAVAAAAGLSRLTLDQMLWRGEWKITPAALKQLAATKAWRTHGPTGATPESIYGKNGAMGHFFNEPFTTRHDLQAALVENHGGGVSMDVIEALVPCCGPRTESPSTARGK